MTRLAFSTLGCPDWSWHDLLRRGPEFGYQGVELRLLARQTDLLSVAEFRPAERARRRRELSDAGLEVCGLASSVRFDDRDRAARDDALATGREYLELTRELGGSFVRVFGDVLPEGASETERRAAMEWIAEGLSALGEIARPFGIDVLLETHGDYSDSRVVEETLRLVSSPAVGVLWDTHHPWRFLGEKVAETFARLKPWVRHTHWKDSVTIDPQRRAAEPNASTEVAAAAEAAHRLMTGHRHADYVLFGDGEFPIDDCLALLVGADYPGWYSLEWEKMWHPEIADPETALPRFSREFGRRIASAQNRKT